MRSAHHYDVALRRNRHHYDPSRRHPAGRIHCFARLEASRGCPELQRDTAALNFQSSSQAHSPLAKFRQSGCRAVMRPDRRRVVSEWRQPMPFRQVSFCCSATFRVINRQWRRFCSERSRKACSCWNAASRTCPAAFSATARLACASTELGWISTALR